MNVDLVLQQLTLDEKIHILSGVDFWHTYAIPRLNIPSIRTSDGPNGVRGTKFFDSVPAACFPCGTGLAATFNKKLLYEVGELMGVEARHKSAHVLLGPTTNMQRGPLGGRGFESFSEDPHLAGLVSAAIINGIQSKKVAATIKHYVANDLEHERKGSDSVLTERALREIYLEPFRLALKHSNPKALMTSYNKVNGIHVSHHKHLLLDILRDEWKYDGTIMSDWWGTYTSKEAIQAGLDLEMPGPTRFRDSSTIGHMAQTRELHVNDIDLRVKNILKLISYASQSGIPENGNEDTLNNTKETAALLRKVSCESIVLLKNEGILPLKSSDKIAVIGPNAKYAAYCGGGSAALKAYYTVTPYQGICSKLDYQPPYSVGAYAHQKLPSMAQRLVNPVTQEAGYNMKFYHDVDRKSQFDEINTLDSRIFLADYHHHELHSNLYYIDVEGSLKVEESGAYEFGVAVWGTAKLFINDKLVIDNSVNQIRGPSFTNLGTIEVKNTITLEAGYDYNLKIEFGSIPTSTIKSEGSPPFGGGGIQFGFAKVIDADEEIANAVSIAKNVDKVVLCIGLNQEWESEGYDRPNMELPGRTNDLVRAVVAENPNTIVVNQSGTPVEFPWLRVVPAVVQAWYGGNETGNAIADVLFGDFNPCGKLSLTWPFKVQDNPTFLNFRTEKGRVLYGEDVFIGYRYYEKLQKQVAFPFGFGLSYSEFVFSNLQVSAQESLKVTVDVENVAQVAGSETIQVYVAPQNSTVIRPVKELKGFEKLYLEPGEKATVHLDLDVSDTISFFDEYQGAWCAEKGDYQVQVGTSSDDIELLGEFKVAETKYWK